MPTTTPFNNLITFSRGSNATVTGSNGLIQWAPNNLLTFSEQFDNAAWTKNNGTVSANVTAAPDGTTTADKFVENTSSASHFIIQSATTIATSYTFSVYAKAAGRTFVLVYHDQSNSGAVFNLTNGAITTPSGIPLAAASVTDAGNGWYRCAITVTATAASNGFRAQLGDSATNYVYTGDGTSGILLWGAQLELGSTATTYNPTTVKNLLGFSEAFDNAAWTKTGASIVTGAQANPINGLFNAQKLMENTANAQHRVTNSVTLAAAPHTLSAYLKAGERTWALMVNGTIANGFAYFNLSTGVVGSVGAGVTAASIAAVGSGWYRCAITFTAPAGSNGFEIRTASADGISIYTGDGNSGVYIYGALLSDSASLDPYVPTPGAAPSSTAFYGPRFDFDPVTLQPRGLLVEEQRTNLFTYSDDFANAAWTKSSATVTANQAVSPDGTTNADLLQITAQFGRLQAGSVTLGTVYTFSIWARVASGTRVYSLYDAAGNPIGSLTATTTWTRHTITFTAPATSTLYVMQDRNAGPFVDTFIYGAQLEAGAFATSYIPTVASTVTRSADVATISGSLFSQWYRETTGSFVSEFQTSQTGVLVGTSYIIGFDNSASKRIIYIGNGSDTAATFDGTTVIGAAGDATGSVVKAASVYTASDRAIALNGGAVSTGSVAAGYSTAILLNVGQVSSVSSLNGHIRNIRFIPARAADFQLQALST